MRTTIELPEEVFSRAKEQASQQGIDVNQVIAAAVIRQIGSVPNEMGSVPHPRPRSRLPTIKGSGSGMIPSVTPVLEAQTQEEEDIASYRRSLGR